MSNATREVESTVDQSDMRGLDTASQRLVAGLPRSSDGDRRKDAHLLRTRAPRTRNSRIALPIGRADSRGLGSAPG